MSAKLGNCRKCGKLFLRIRDICEECFQKQEDDFIKVAEYLREYPGSTIQELSEATRVTIGQIREFILAERIVPGYFPNLAYSCESCGTMIHSGRKCSDCTNTLNQLAKQMGNQEPKRPAEQPKGKSGGYITRNL